jgi:hypothetical protein
LFGWAHKPSEDDSERKETTMRVGDVMALMALVIVVLIAMIIAANVSDIVGNIGGEGGLFTSTWSAMSLAGVGLIISAAVGILSLVLYTMKSSPSVGYIPEEEDDVLIEETLRSFWVCKYCSTENDIGDDECLGCKAPRKESSIKKGRRAW